MMFVILQKYDFSSKSQLNCNLFVLYRDVCDTAKVRFFKQITTGVNSNVLEDRMFVILQKYDFSSKSQRTSLSVSSACRCLWYCKSTIFQANHNSEYKTALDINDVCDTAKVRFFKQITTERVAIRPSHQMFVILQKYDFSSKSQLGGNLSALERGCLWYCKSTIFQANHNSARVTGLPVLMFVILQKYDFSSKSQRLICTNALTCWCLWYCKSTIFQANHN